MPTRNRSAGTSASTEAKTDAGASSTPLRCTRSRQNVSTSLAFPGGRAAETDDVCCAAQSVLLLPWIKFTKGEEVGLDCPICAKHRGEGPLTGPRVWTGEHVTVYHRPPGEDGTAVLGHLFVETIRHVPYLDSLTDAEAAAVGIAVSRLARGMRAELPAEHVFTAVIGTGVPHYHQHVIARHPGTPDTYAWHASHDWPDAPRGTEPEIADVCRRLTAHLDA
jgi:ATP adenylyltransferase